MGFNTQWKRASTSYPRKGEAGPTESRELEEELRAVVKGEVRFDPGSRGIYSTDASNYRQPPIGVVLPTDEEDVIQTVAVCRRRSVPVLARGGGTSQAGQCCNVAVVLDTSKRMNHLLALDPEARFADVQPGTNLDVLRNAAERYHLTFGPDPSTHSRCTMGGMIGNNSCGVHSIMAGNTVDNVEELDVLTYRGLRLRVGRTEDGELDQIIAQGGLRGELYLKLRGIRDSYAELIRQRYPRIPRRVSGYNLDQLLPENGFHVARALVGTEGTCVTCLGARLRLVSSPTGRSLVVLGFPDVYQASDRVMEVMSHGPIGLEGFDDRVVGYLRKKGMLLDNLALLPSGGGWFVVEFGGDSQEEADGKGRALIEALSAGANAPSGRLFSTTDERQMILGLRESGFGASAHVPGMKETWPGWEDSAVAPEKLGAYLRDLRSLLERYGYQGGFYGHYGQGCIHALIDFDLKSAAGIAGYRAFVEEAADLVVSYGGSLSGEHGDGQARGELLPRMYGEELVQAFREFKQAWDPDNMMNPGKVLAGYRLDDNLRLGPNYSPPELATHFHYPTDGGSFAHAALRCVGVGKCRGTEQGTMCPSYMATREEAYSTRGRARILFEMLRGDVVSGGWRDEHVKNSLDLCLACKGCKTDCPVSVDMATYKAEFLSHYYSGRLRPLIGYAFGLITYWARIASRMPSVANFFTQTPALAAVAKRVIGVAPERQLPAFAAETFKRWFVKRGVKNQGSPQVVLWPDTANNYFRPETAQAGVEVLEAAGFQVLIPARDLCCGRPLYDFGMIDLAKRLLRQVMDALEPELARGTPVVGLEPSCVSVFRDELTNLFPDDPRARQLSSQSYLLSEFLSEWADLSTFPRLNRKVLLHGHCHHKSIMTLKGDQAILDSLGVDYTTLDSGCCGMAGAFGFEKDNYEVSIATGERVLLPAVRAAERDTIVIADGFSCREQIAQTTDRHGLHLAQLIQMALREGPDGPPSGVPEAAYLRPEPSAGETAERSLLRAALAVAGSGLLAAAVWWLRRRR